MTPFDVTGRVALVTGARTGLGRAVALALAGAGADIAGLGSRPIVPMSAWCLPARRAAAILIARTETLAPSKNWAEVVRAEPRILARVYHAGSDHAR